MKRIHIALLSIAILPSACGHFPTAMSMDHGRYTNSPLKSWFDSLQGSDGIPCCDIADGKKVEDVDWDSKDGHYRVRLNGEWMDVPDTAVIHQPNKFGPAVVWPYEVNGKTRIRCFIAGAGM